MAKKSSLVNSYQSAPPGRGKKTSIGSGNVAFASMNKNMKRSWKKYRGQGR